MCAIVGALLQSGGSLSLGVPEAFFNITCERSMERGRDGRGYATLDAHKGFRHYADVERKDTFDGDFDLPIDTSRLSPVGVIANFRAEPTTEYVRDKSPADQQPYILRDWAIVHNGTIANDKDFRTGEKSTSIDSAAIVELLASADMRGLPASAVAEYFAHCIDKLKGSYAILAMHREHPGMMLVACNYRPIWYATDRAANVYFASSRDYFPDTFEAQMIEPYSVWAFTHRGGDVSKSCVARQNSVVRRALVVCSGGMDSVVAAASVIKKGYEVELIHFQYDSRAQGPELNAIKSVAGFYNVPLTVLPMHIYKPEDSPLLRKDSAIAGGEAGAEFAHEWVPARNLVMLALATAYAEANGFQAIVLGNNLEEAGAYPDNEPEFIRRFNDMLPFAVGDGKRVRIEMPVGNLMKHEIVALGHQLGAPLHLTWSCYRAGEKHCGTCGPCYMRRTAFEINNLPEVIEYENKGS